MPKFGTSAQLCGSGHSSFDAQRPFYHHESFAFYFDDPDGNMIEVYWPTGDPEMWPC